MLRRLITLIVMLVIGMSTINAQTSAPDYFVEASVDQLDPFVGQQIRYQFRFYTAVLLTDVIYEPSDFEGFWRVPGNPRAEQTVVNRDGRQYTVTTVETVLFPTRSGEQTIEPARVLLPETVFRAEQIVSASPIILQVRPLPDGAPEGFAGAVGRFTLEARLSQTSGVVGEPILLGLTVAGTGNVEALLSPRLGLSNVWRVQENPPRYRVATTDANDLIIGVKDYEFQIIPVQAGALPVPSIDLVYFDPQALAYRSLTTAPLAVEVIETDADFSAPPIGTPGSPVMADIRTLKLTLSQTWRLSDAPFMVWLAWLAPPAGFLMVTLLVLGRRHSMRRQQRRRQESALRQAQSRLKTAARTPDRGYASIEKALQIYFEDRLGRPRRSIDRPALEHILDESGFHPDTLDSLRTCLSIVIEGQYAPQTPEDMSALISRIITVLKAVEQEWPPA